MCCAALRFCYRSCFSPIPEATAWCCSPSSPWQQAGGAETGRGGAWRAVAGTWRRLPSSPPACRHREESQCRGEAGAGAGAGRGGALQGAGP